jgi:hypothetical protein
MSQLALGTAVPFVNSHSGRQSPGARNEDCFPELRLHHLRAPFHTRGALFLTSQPTADAAF